MSYWRSCIIEKDGDGVKILIDAFVTNSMDIHRLSRKLSSMAIELLDSEVDAMKSEGE